MERTLIPPEDTWSLRLIIVAAAIAIWLAAFWPTHVAMVSIWIRSDTFGHDFIIVPITVYLVWLLRDELRVAPRHTDFTAAIPLLGLVVLWTLARAGDVQVIQQFAAVAMVPVLVWLLVGRAATRVMLFPLCFLLFMVPVGEGLIPIMIEYTADATVVALRLSGIPVFREGTNFSLPTGNWSVVEACSGVRYLIASITVGVVYAYLNYYQLWRRALFVALSVIVPIFANWIRAYLIVMTGHLSGMKIAVGIDHIFYGWVFFGIVIFLLFLLGSLWRDEAPAAAAEGPAPAPAAPAGSGGWRGGVAGLVVAAVIIASGPAWWSYLEGRSAARAAEERVAPAGVKDWAAVDEDFGGFEPRYVGPSSVVRQAYAADGPPVGLYLAYYDVQSQGAELINSQNVLVHDGDPTWRRIGRSVREARFGGDPGRVIETRLRAGRRELLVWHWYAIGEAFTTSQYEAKLREVARNVLGRPAASVGIVIFTAASGQGGDARRRLQRFADEMVPAVAKGFE